MPEPASAPRADSPPRGGEPVPLPATGSPRPDAHACPRCKHDTRASDDFCSRCGYSFLETRSFTAGEPASPAPAAGLVGQVVNGKYRVLSILGEGGFGVVYKVELLLFDRGGTFALKLLHPALSQDKGFRRRFLREAGLSMALIHENTIQIREFGQTEDGQLFFTMDYCPGESLKAIIAREGYLNVHRAIPITRQILSVMKLAHARGIIHRDLKPENIFLEKDAQGRDFVKVGDFGLAKSYGPADGAPEGARLRLPGDDITRGAILGTPRYMSPEQALGKEDLDNRSDLYSIGVILYEMLYGQVPLERFGPDAQTASLKTPPVQPNHAVPRPVWEVVRRALEVPRESRYQSAEEFLAAIKALPKYVSAYVEPETSQRRRRLRSTAAILLAAGAGMAAMVMLQAGGLGLPGARSWRGSGKVVTAPSRSEDSSNTARAETSAFPRGGVRAFLPFADGDYLRYLTFRNGSADREIVYQVTDDPSAGRFTVTAAGDRTFSWIIDDKENVLYQEFSLPDPKTGELGIVVRRPLLKLPKGEALVDADYTDGELRVHRARVDLELPHDSRFPYDVYPDCLRVESRVDGRHHYQYFKEGYGIVGIEVYGPDGGPPIFGRYLIETTRER